MRSLGLHLQQTIALVGSGRPSAVAELDRAGRLSALTFADSDDEILAAIGTDRGVVAIDAPTVVTNDRGRRPVEELLAWCDIPAFPVSRARHMQVFGGLRGETLAARLPGGLRPAETLPDLMLRLWMWSDAGNRDELDLAGYRARWPGIRPPRFRPKGAGRAAAAGVVEAWGVLARHVDLDGWTPEGGDDWGAIRDAAAIDAILCAAVAWRSIHDPAATMLIGSPQSGAMAIPVDANLRGRLQVNIDRLAGG